VWVPALKTLGWGAWVESGPDAKRFVPNLRIHDLRHTAVALATNAGGHPKQIQAQMGHSSIRVTLDRYGHLFDSLAEDLADRVHAMAEAARAADAYLMPEPGASVHELHEPTAG
jgi:integrase